MRTLSSLLPGAAMFVAALTVNAATVCQGEILNPVTDVCWSCVFPVKIGGKASLTTSVLPDPDTGAGGPFCTCGKGLNLRAGVTFSFWEPLRTAEIVRHAGCLPSMGGVNMGDMELRISDHVKVHSHEPDGSMKRHTDFRRCTGMRRPGSSFSRRSLTTGVWTSRRSTSPTCPNLIPYGTTRSRASS